MNRITEFIKWVETRLDEGGWVRRSYLVVATLMAWNFVIWSQNFAMTSPRPGAEVAMIIGAIGAVVAPITAFAFNNYLESRRKPAGETSVSTSSTKTEVVN